MSCLHFIPRSTVIITTLLDFEVISPIKTSVAWLLWPVHASCKAESCDINLPCDAGPSALAAPRANGFERTAGGLGGRGDQRRT